MEIEKPLSKREYSVKHQDLKAVHDIKSDEVRRRSIIGVSVAAVVAGIAAMSFFAFMSSSTWVSAIFLTVIAVLLILAAFKKWADAVGHSEAYRQLSTLEYDHGPLSDCEIAELTKLVTEFPEIKAVVKSWQEEKLEAKHWQLVQLRRYAANLKTKNLQRVLQAAIEQ